MITGPGGLQRGEDLFLHFAARQTSSSSHAALLGRVDAATNLDDLARAIDALTDHALVAIAEGRFAPPSEILRQLVPREERAGAAGAAPIAQAIRQLATERVLRMVARELVTVAARSAESMAVLARAGEAGADALIEELVGATDRGERRVYFDALAELKAGVGTLLHMLGDSRWYVVRNAAVLLGEMKAPQADVPLAALLEHDDYRVRHAAIVALIRLGVSLSLSAVTQVLRDDSSDVRIQVAAALGLRREPAATALLLHALERERHDDVRAALLLALARTGSVEGVQRLIAEAQPSRPLLRRRPVRLRVAAVRALASAKTPAAASALRTLARDREAEVRAAAIDGIAGRLG